MIILNFFKAKVTFVLDFDPKEGFVFLPPFVLNKICEPIKLLGEAF